MANEGQKRAYHSKGHCVILAGPGSGKTTTITVKIARLIHEEIPEPRGVACITYSTECAREIHRRLEVLGVADSPHLFLGTLHSFCLRAIILPFAHLVDLPVKHPFGVVDDGEAKELMLRAMRDVGMDPARLKFVWKDIQELRFGLLEGKRVAPTSPTRRIYKRYQEVLQSENVIDFLNMVEFGLLLVENYPWIRSLLAARFEAIVVDEYQDLGVALHKLVTTLCFTEAIRLIAVGDPHQSIFGFAQARPELLQELADRRDVERVELNLNYRCAREIVEASKIALGTDPGHKSAVEGRGVITFVHEPLGLPALCERVSREVIPALRAQQVGLHEIAILYREKKFGDAMAASAKVNDLPFVRFDAGAPYRKTPLTRWLEDCAKWSSGGWLRGHPRLSNLTRTWLILNQRAPDEDASRDLVVTFHEFLLAHRDQDMPLRAWLDKFEVAVLRPCFDGPLKDEHIAYRKLAAEALEGGMLGATTVATFTLQAGSPGHLNLTTLHSSKGLQYKAVILLGMEEGVVPDARSVTKDEIDADRRLFYVGLTRAMRIVVVTYSGWYTNFFDDAVKKGPSRFVEELRTRTLAVELGSAGTPRLAP